jgi:hypothetical protein
VTLRQVDLLVSKSVIFFLTRRASAGGSETAATLLHMKTTTYEAVVENGQIKLPATLHLPDHTKILIVVPDAEAISAAHIYSPRLAHPDQAADFTKEVLKES